MKEAAGRGLYRQWGIAPRPEDKEFSCFLEVVYDTSPENATPAAKKFYPAAGGGSTLLE